MEWDSYVIDENVARSDMQKMNQAVELLKNARKALSQLINSAGAMQGDTCRAIEEKSQELQKRIDDLTGHLNTSVNQLQIAVANYQRIDAEHAASIGRGGN